jgi:uncharacterized protein YkwD
MKTPAVFSMGSMWPSWRLLGMSLLPAVLAACGGGGDSAPAAATPAALAGAPAAAASSPGVAAPSAAATCNLPDFQAAAMARINQWRASGATCGARGAFAPSAALSWSARLTQAATGHSSDMAAQNYFSHTSRDGRTLSDRIDATGYPWSTIGENIAAGYATVNIVVDAWIASEGHCVNLLNPAFTEVGLACVPGTASTTYNNYWTMDLARPL